MHREGCISVRLTLLRGGYGKLFLSDGSQSTRERSYRPSEPLSEKLITDKIRQACGVVRGKWRPEALVTLELPYGEVATTRYETEDALAGHHFRHVDEVQQAAVNKTDDPDWFDIEELEFSL